MPSLLVHGGHVADADGTRRADVLVRDGEIAAVGKDAQDAEDPRRRERRVRRSGNR